MIKRIRTAVLVLLACLGLAAAGLGLVLGTEKGRQFLLDTLARATAAPDFSLRMEGLRLGAEWTLERMVMGDASGPWFEAEGLSVRPVLADLLKGRLTLLHAGASRLDLMRLPASPESGDEPQAAQGPALPPLRVQALDIDSLRIGPDVAGHEALLALRGSLDLGPDEPGATLRVARLDRIEDVLELDARLRLPAGTMDLRLDLHEGPQGLMHAALGVNGTRGISLRASGQGPLEAWDMTIQSVLSDVASLSGNATLDLGREPGAHLRALVTPGPSWTTFTGLPEAETSVEVRGRWRESVLRISDLTLSGPLGALQGNATWDFDSAVLESEADIRDADLAWLMPEDAVTGPIQASASLRLDSEGLRTQGSIMLRDTVVSGYAAPEAQARFDLDMPAGARSWRARTQIETRLPDLPEGLRSWTANATLGQDGDALALDSLRLESERLGLTANATLDSLVSAQVRLDVRRLPVLADQPPLSAVVDATLGGRLDAAASSLNASLETHAAGIQGLPAALADLLGQEIRLSADLNLSPRLIRIREAKLRARTTADASADFDLPENTFAARLDATLPQLRLDLLQAPRGATLRASASGRPEAFDLDLSLAAATLAVQDASLDSLTATVSATGLPGRPAATVRADATIGEDPLALDLRVEPVQGGLRFSQTRLQLPGAALSFSADLDPNTLLAAGDAHFQGTDLSALGRILGVDLGGEFSLHARLDAQQGKQRARLTGEGKSISADNLGIGSASLTGVLADPGLPGGTDVQLELRSAVLAGISADRVGARLRSVAEGVGFDIGLAHAPSHTDVTARGRLSPDLARLVVEDLRGTLLRQDLRLQSPLDLTASAGRTAWRETALSFGPATLRARGDISRDRAEIGADLAGFDPALLRPLFPTLPGARVNARLDVSGVPAEPDAHLRMRAEDIRLDGADEDQLPDLDAAVDLRLRQNVLAAQANLASKSGIELDARVSGPMPLNLLAPEFPASAPLSGRLSGQAKLLLLPRLLNLDDQTLDGNCDLDFAIGGTWENPALSGAALVRDARYENFRSGTILERVNMDARADGSTLTLKLDATDGGQGKAEAVGQVDLLTFRHIFDVLFDRFQLLRQDLVQSTAKGGLRLQGDAGGSELRGNMTLDPTRVRLPSKIPADLAQIEVHEINAENPPPAPADRTSDFLLDLDLKVAVPARMTVEGRGLESEWSGNIHVGGNQVRPVISGEMNLLRGKFDFLDRTFDLTKGVVSLGGENPPNPFLEVLGETQILENLIQVRISGPARDFRLSLTSVPALPQDELLAMILFGRSLRQISPLQAVRLAQAAAEMTGLGGATPDFLDSVKSSLGLQEVDVSRDDEDNTAVGIGGYIGGKYYVRTQSSVSGQDRTRVEIQLTPRISVETEVGADSRQGGGVMWKKDY